MEQIEKQIKDLVLKILLSELQEYGLEEDPANRQKKADAISKIAGVLKKIEAGDIEEEDEEDLSQILSRLREEKVKVGRSIWRFFEEFDLKEFREKLLAAHSLVITLETTGKLGEREYELLREIRQLLEYLIVREFA